MGRARTIPSTHAGATPRYVRHSEAVSPWRNACRVLTSSPIIMSTGESTSRTLNSWLAPRTTVAGSAADVSTVPAALKSHWTLLSTRLVSAVKRSPSVALAMEVEMQPAGWKTQSNVPISER